MDELYPDKFKKMKDSFGWHRVKVYNDTRILKKIIEARVKARKTKDEDTIYLVTGIEGSGKSTVCAWAYDIYSKITGEEMTVDNVTRNVDELMTRLYYLQREKFLIMDEGAELYSEKHNNKQNQDMKEKFTVMRARLFMIFLCFTNPLRIGTYFREDRVRGVFFVKSKGCVYYYANSPEHPHFTEIMSRWHKDNATKSLKSITRYAPDYIMYYPKYEGKFWEDYKVRKDSQIDKVFTKGLHNIELAKEYVSRAECAKILNIRPASVGNYTFKGSLKRYMIGITPMYKLSEVNDLLKTIREQTGGRGHNLRKGFKKSNQIIIARPESCDSTTVTN